MRARQRRLDSRWQVRHDRPPLLATVQHLIPRGAAGRYLEEIDAARDGLKPWRVSVTGPWPAYAFAEEAA